MQSRAQNAILGALELLYAESRGLIVALWLVVVLDVKTMKRKMCNCLCVYASVCVCLLVQLCNSYALAEDSMWYDMLCVVSGIFVCVCVSSV